MDKIFIETSLGELLDKISILEIKSDKIKDSINKDEIAKEYTSLRNTLGKMKFDIDQKKRVNQAIIDLKKINTKLWEVEDQKRLAEKNKNFNEMFIDLARSVYKLNDQRAKIKRNVNESFDSNIKEIKKYTNY